jgi:hypothetical protein
MPTFHKKTSRPTTARSTRKFVVKGKKSPVKSRAPRVVVKPKAKSADQAVPVVERPIEATVKTSETTASDKPKLQSRFVANKADATMRMLDNLLGDTPAPVESAEPAESEVKETRPAFTSRHQGEDDNAVYWEDKIEAEPREFDGINTPEEKEELYSEVLDYEKRKAKVVEEQLKLIARERDEERKALEKEIKTLKQELHRTTPIQDNKFFSLSKELREAILDIERIASDSGLPVSELPVGLPPAGQLPQPVAAAPQSGPAQNPAVAQPVAATSQPEVAAVPREILPGPQKEKKRLTKKKALITGVAATVLLLVISGVMVRSFIQDSGVDEQLVAEYLEKQSGQVQGAVSENGQVKKEEDPAQANVTFEESVWDEFKDPSFGVLLQYPKNAVKAIRTESNITFIRKTGYLFKVQRIETALTAKEYWKQISATSLSYEVADDKFKGKEALKLTLLDVTDYPGDRILVKEGNFIYDIWYATASRNFPNDDILRAEKMLSSLSIVGAR